MSYERSEVLTSTRGESVMTFRGQLTCFSQLLFERIAVDPVVVLLELVREIVDFVNGLPGNDPQSGRLAAAAVLLPRVGFGELLVRRLDRAGVGEGLSLAL